MSIRTVILALVVALALGGAAFFLLTKKEPPAAPGTILPGAVLLELEPAAVQSVRIVSPDGDEQWIERAPQPGVWNAVVNVGKANERRWRLQDGAAAALLRRLAETRAISEPTKEDIQMGVGAGPSVVRIVMENGSTRTMRFAARTLAGRGLVEIEPVGASTESGGAKAGATLKPLLAVVDDSLHRVFRNPGPKGWRDVAAVSGLSPDISRIWLDNVDRQVLLGKVEGKWAVIDPIACPAETDSVRKLIATLSELTIDTFFDDELPPSDTTGLMEPIARIVIETDRSVTDGAGGTPRVVTETREVLVGKPSQATLQRRYASLSKDGPVVTINSASLTQETFMPTRYVLARAIDGTIGDIGGVVMEPAQAAQSPAVDDAPTTPVSPPSAATAPLFPTRVYKRALDKWEEFAGGQQTVLPDEDAKQVNELLSFFAGEAPRQIDLKAPEGWTERGTLRLLSLGGGPLSVLTVGSLADGSLSVRSDDVRGRSVYRTYTTGRAPLLLNPMAAALKAEADAKPKPPEPIDGDTMK